MTQPNPPGQRFNPPPSWPTPPSGWTPPPDWQPPTEWPAAPPGWQFWVPEQRKSRAAKHAPLLAILAVVGVVLAVAVVAAVAASTGSVKRGAGANPPRPVPVASETAQGEVLPDASSTPEALIASIGPDDRIVYDDGLEVSVLSIRRFRISEVAAGGQPGDVGIKVVVRIKNATHSAFDLTLVDVNMKVGPNGLQVDRVFDEGINDFEGTVTPFHAAAATVGFAANPAELTGPVVVQVRPDLSHPPATFEGSVPG